MENLGNTEVRRDRITSRTYYIFGWIVFVGVEMFRNVVQGPRDRGGAWARFGLFPPLSFPFRHGDWRPIPVLVETGSSTARRQRARWIFLRR